MKQKHGPFFACISFSCSQIIQVEFCCFKILTGKNFHMRIYLLPSNKQIYKICLLQGSELSRFIQIFQISLFSPDRFWKGFFPYFSVKKICSKKRQNAKKFWLKFLKAKPLNRVRNENQSWNYQENLFILEKYREKILGGFVQIFEPANSAFYRRPVLILRRHRFRTVLPQNNGFGLFSCIGFFSPFLR